MTQGSDLKPMNLDSNPALAYAVRVVRAVCCLAGSASYVEDIRDDLRDSGVARAVMEHDTPTLFDWLNEALSYQGISDTLAADYNARHGTIRWSDISHALSEGQSCPKLGGYWRFSDCSYRKWSVSCSEPGHFGKCPLPRHPLRNGRLNQTAYSLFFFMRDIADGDFVDWVDRQLAEIDGRAPDYRAQRREAIIGPLRNVYGVSDKVLAMALSQLLLSTGKRRRIWFEVGTDLIAIDTLVHNFLHRTGVLHRLSAVHPYGPACYQPGGCETVVRAIAEHIDTREFNATFPAYFPRFVQSAIWRYCAESGLDVCNGNRIDDNAHCQNAHCQLYRRCDRIILRESAENTLFISGL